MIRKTNVISIKHKPVHLFYIKTNKCICSIKTFVSMLSNLIIFVIFLHGSLCTKLNGTINTLRHPKVRPIRYFPEEFRFGIATAAYQVEGAWDEDGKSPSIWDDLTHSHSYLIKDGSNGDTAANSYHMYKRDIEMLRELGVDFYRFSISWSRILPTGFPNQVNEAGLDYYNKLIDEMLKYSIEPMITLYHWDLPQKIQRLGGWTNPHIIDWFTDYAHLAFNIFGDRVKHWVTINEPYQICYMGYGHNYVAPAVDVRGIADYICAKNVLLAHAKAYHMYHEEFKPTQGGIIFMTFSAQWYEPATVNDTQAAEDSHQFMWALYVHPIHSTQGDYPAVVKERVAAKSFEQGFTRSRLIELSREEIRYIRGTSDIFGLNHYTTFLVHKNATVNTYYESPSLQDDNGAILFQKKEWRIGDSGYIKSVSWGFYKLLTKIREDYDNPPIFICENGFASHGGLDDDDRIYHLRSYLSVLLDAIQDGSDIRAFTMWTLMDSFEWMQGYVERFGLYEVDYDDPGRTCTPRKSAYIYKQIAQSHILDFTYEPKDRPHVLDFKSEAKDNVKNLDFVFKANDNTPSLDYIIEITDNPTNIDYTFDDNGDSHTFGYNTEPTEDPPFSDVEFEARGSVFNYKRYISEIPSKSNFNFDPNWNASVDLNKSMNRMINVTNEIVKTVVGL